MISRTGVSYVMPVLNDVTHVRRAVESLFAQDYDGDFDITIALGPSIDGTTELVRDLASRDPRITLVTNEIGSTPAGLNLAIEKSSFDVVVRVDAHSVLPRDYTKIALETLKRTGAVNVGGVMDARGESPFQCAVAQAYKSRVGLGGAAFHVGGAEGPADSVYLGCFQREHIVRLGLFDETVKRGQDWELNVRIRESGGLVWFTPLLRVRYFPRAKIVSLAKQMFSTGMWRGELAKRYPGKQGLKYFAPPLFVVSIFFSVLVLLFFAEVS